ncbi:MAG TPA: PHP domain-containing protein [Thermomicrobiales bacterium]|nr:PHP domain-containing protein [Thermomicrobiales bacterium]
MTAKDTNRANRPSEGSFWPVDLHAHTTASDGTLAPDELVDFAVQRGVEILGVTDHDTVDGIEAASRRASERRVTLMPGVELSTTERGSEVHVLGYGVDLRDASLRKRLADLAASRVRRISAMIEKLCEAGYAIDGDAVLAQADEGSIGRPHVARALIEIGVVASVDEAFDRFLKPGRPGWVPREPFTPEQAVQLLRDHGVLPVLAHPLSTRDVPGVLRRLIPVGLRGMEVWYGEYDPGEREALRRTAEEHNLLATGGSDYHGPRFRAGRELGSVPVPREVFDRLVDAGVRV